MARIGEICHTIDWKQKDMRQVYKARRRNEETVGQARKNRGLVSCSSSPASARRSKKESKEHQRSSSFGGRNSSQLLTLRLSEVSGRHSAHFSAGECGFFRQSDVRWKTEKVAGDRSWVTPFLANRKYDVICQLFSWKLILQPPLTHIIQSALYGRQLQRCCHNI